MFLLCSFIFGIPQPLDVGHVRLARYSCTKYLVLIYSATTLNSTPANWHGDPSCMLHRGLVIPKFKDNGHMTIVIGFPLFFSSALI
jgi:hypothetical protein